MNTFVSERLWAFRFWENRTYPSENKKKELEQRFVFQVWQNHSAESGLIDH
jgi:hypothetical protein